MINDRISNRLESSGKLLDVGCGTGEFLKAAKKDGWQVFGYEPSTEARSKADALIAENIKPSLSIVRNTGNKFDVVTLWHVLEHVESLNDTIDELKEMLTLHGSMYIAVPNHRSWDSQHYRDHWAAYDVPRHIWHFNIQNMKQLMAKHGLTIAEIIPMRLDAFYVSLLSEKYLSGKKLSVSSLMKALVNGARSNYIAQKTMEYSSLIYVVKHATR
jgi:2-polyprenyl-3-methyl-5-hydroxy-6-metoxy-1,4-benzoquinol methylase